MNTPLSDGLTTASTNADIDWYGTVRGRLGWTQGPVLFYGSAGLAYGREALNSSMNMPIGPLALSSSTSSVKTGWVAGGVDYHWSPNVVVGVQYQYVDLGSVSLASSATIAGPFTLAQNANAHAQFQVVTAGISWLFSPSPAGWQGFYAGGQVGGAWGNDTSAVYSSVSPPAISDIRLKRDVVLIARLDNGLGLYRYRYLWSDTVYVGVMAQEVALIRPDAVVRGALDDYLRVDYGRLGLRLMTLPQWEAVSKGERL